MDPIKKQEVENYWKTLSIPERINKINALEINLSAQTMLETMEKVFDAFKATPVD
jgi:hypothetical protein